jgi:hypothetical protein
MEVQEKPTHDPHNEQHNGYPNNAVDIVWFASL